MDLLEPYLMAVVDEMMDNVEAGKMWTLAHVPEAVMILMQGCNDMSVIIPDSFFEVCEMIKPLVPEEVKPAGDSVLVHIFVSGLVSFESDSEMFLMLNYKHVSVWSNQ